MSEKLDQASVQPLACIPGAIPSDVRPAHFALISHLFGHAVEEKVDVTNGYGFRFPADRFDELVRFISNERRCCPFLSFAVDVAPDGGPVWLRMTGPAGTREFLDAELS